MYNSAKEFDKAKANVGIKRQDFGAFITEKGKSEKKKPLVASLL